MAILLILWIIQAGVGLAIGRAKGRPGLGLLLGALLGVFGWIALAFVRPSFEIQVRRERLHRQVELAAGDTRPGIPGTLATATAEQVHSMTSAERQEYTRNGVIPARFAPAASPRAGHYRDSAGWHRKHDVYGGPHDEPPQTSEPGCARRNTD